MPRDKGSQVGEEKGKQAASDNAAVATTTRCWLDTAAAAIGPRCWPARHTAHTDAGAKQDLAPAAAKPPSNWTEAGTWYWGVALLGPFSGPPAGDRGRGLPSARGASAGAERRGGVLCADPAYAYVAIQ
jgi:hypothetical protein